MFLVVGWARRSGVSFGNRGNLLKAALACLVVLGVVATWRYALFDNSQLIRWSRTLINGRGCHAVTTWLLLPLAQQLIFSGSSLTLAAR